jgi:very-short-patch-repair endonuclease
VALRRRQVAGLYFRRQHPIARVIVDFCCVEQRLVVEVDGPVHDRTAAQDAARQAWLESRGYRVLRFTNDEIMDNLERVIESIHRAVREDALPDS